MCLDTAGIEQTPFKNSKVRWKVMVKNKSTGEIESPVVHVMKWRVGQTYIAERAKVGAVPRGYHDIGFHVFPNRESARKLRSYWESMYSTASSSDFTHIVVKVEVSMFIAAGVFETCQDSYLTETWQRCKMVEIAR